MSDQATIFELPYNLFLMQRMEFVVICGDHLAANIMRIIEVEMIKRKETWQVRVEEATEKKKPLPKEPRTWWVRLSQAQIIARLYMYDSAKLKKPESKDLTCQEWVEYRFKRALSISKATLKKAIELLKALGFLIERSKPGDEFGAPIYTLNKENVQAAIKKLPANPFTIFHHLGGVENIDTGGDSKNFNVPPKNSDSGDSKNLTVPPEEFSPGESQNFQVDIDITIDPPEDTEIDNGIEGSAREDDEHSQPGANAQPPARTLEETPYVPDYSLTSHSQPPTEEPADDNHHHGTDHRVGAGAPAERDRACSQAPGAPAGDGADQGHAGATGRAAGVAGETRSHGSAQGASAGDSGYQKPAQATLAGTSQQESARRGPVDVSTLTIKAHINYCFKWLNAVRQKAEEDPQASYVQSRSAEKLVRELIEATMNTANELTERNVYIAWMAMWKAPAGKDGFTWSEPGKISVAAFCRNYGEYLARGRASLAKSAQSKSSQTPTNETVSGLPRWVPPSAPAYAG